ncbi:PAS domain-containing protein [Clostridium fermenticellae]|uniref:PAS domain-containing protein n=1 Tax=Clostridium fermenticellae TaxID=2068654 RepID=A0A386H4H6_9CLOT|nr:sigma 54-interacting transcriptional regulator [Clostridium fermenticellae]AYD40651.1 PAS domain-containing protein [Clostridium fermenticellae]
MIKKIGFIASDEKLKDIVVHLFRKEVEQGEIIIEILDPDNMKSQGKILESRGANAIIARSGGYRHTVGTVNVPVINLKISTLDILYAVKRASKYKKDIVIVISDLEYFSYDDWKDVIRENIIIEKFEDKDNIECIINKYKEIRDEVVIVGGGIPCIYAENLGIDNVSIGASNESICDAIEHAKQLVDSLYEQNYRNEVLNTILDGVHDAVIAIDKSGKIILYNERARELLKKSRTDVMEKSIETVCPELIFMMGVLNSGVNQYNKIQNLPDIVITANTSVLKIDGQTHGVLCSFQDITKLQNLEKKIRYELNKKGLVARYKFENIIANDPIMKNTVSKAIKIGLDDSTVMIYGESGTGKEMFAQSIHNISSRKKEPFVAINCAAISESLLESELFGYEEGAFTGARKGGKPGLFELAHGGTIFLDEINSMSLNLQAKLLRVLEEKEVMRIGSDYVIPLDVRIIAAANENLEGKIKNGTFRSDLFYRLSTLELHISPLRERKEDIIPLFMHYLTTLSKKACDFKLESKIEKKIMNYSWPGNVRELRNIVQRYLIFHEVDLDENEILENNSELVSDENVLDLKQINKFVEEKVIQMLENSGMSKNEIAKKLGISRTALWRKVKS